MDVVGDLLARDRRSRDIALVTADGRERTYHDLITNAYKAANVLRYLGAREGSTVAVEPTPRLHTTLAFLGAAGLGAAVRFDPDAGIAAGDRVVLVDVADEERTDPAPGTNLAVFDGPPERAETTHWEQDLWSENPGMPPSSVESTDPLVRDADRDVSHADVLSAAASVIEAHDIDEETRVVLRGSFATVGAVTAGIVAPLAAGGTVVLTDPSGTDGDARGDLAVVAEGQETAPEARSVPVADVFR
ncbi:hypothetical protein [Halorubrum sp. DTA46]|uniref:hypothetical protein n=1 Tax=Halorubrum sp. DTA46 TaxID=3402162 RepID=UPI003AAA7339